MQIPFVMDIALLISMPLIIIFSFGSVKTFVNRHLIYRCSIATDKRGYRHNIFLFLDENMLWYSLEASRRGASNEYPQHIFLLRSKKDISIFG